jgi:hypothetical protein
MRADVAGSDQGVDRITLRLARVRTATGFAQSLKVRAQLIQRSDSCVRRRNKSAQ